MSLINPHTDTLTDKSRCKARKPKNKKKNTYLQNVDLRKYIYIIQLYILHPDNKLMHAGKASACL